MGRHRQGKDGGEVSCADGGDEVLRRRWEDEVSGDETMAGAKQCKLVQTSFGTNSNKNNSKNCKIECHENVKFIAYCSRRQ